MDPDSKPHDRPHRCRPGHSSVWRVLACSLPWTHRGSSGCLPPLTPRRWLRGTRLSRTSNCPNGASFVSLFVPIRRVPTPLSFPGACVAPPFTEGPALQADGTPMIIGGVRVNAALFERHFRFLRSRAGPVSSLERQPAHAYLTTVCPLKQLISSSPPQLGRSSASSETPDGAPLSPSHRQPFGADFGVLRRGQLRRGTPQFTHLNRQYPSQAPKRRGEGVCGRRTPRFVEAKRVPGTEQPPFLAHRIAVDPYLAKAR